VRTDSGLWLPSGFSFAEHRKTVRTVTLPNGKRAKVTVDDSGTVLQQECDDRLDAVVRPKTVRLKIRSVT
jgi:hypothetical protein